MLWTRMLAYITGTVDQELLLRSEYLAAMALRKTARSRNPLHWSSASRPSTPSTMPSSMTRTPSVDGNIPEVSARTRFPGCSQIPVLMATWREPIRPRATELLELGLD